MLLNEQQPSEKSRRKTRVRRRSTKLNKQKKRKKKRSKGLVEAGFFSATSKGLGRKRVTERKNELETQTLSAESKSEQLGTTKISRVVGTPG